MTTVGLGRPWARRPSRLPITLADLITAIQDVVGPEDDGLVVATVRHLLRSGRLTGLRSGTRRRLPPCQETRCRTSGGVRHPSAVARPWLCGRSPSGRGERGAIGRATDRSSERRGRHGRGLAECWSGRGAGGACGIGRSDSLPTREARAEARIGPRGGACGGAVADARWAQLFGGCVPYTTETRRPASSGREVSPGETPVSYSDCTEAP
jgi:hypothetical protein